jgi:hypothetical protein
MYTPVSGKDITLTTIAKQIIKTIYYAHDNILNEFFNKNTKNIISYYSVTSGCLLVPTITFDFQFHRGFIDSGKHFLKQLPHSKSTLFWLITDFLYLFIIEAFITWVIYHRTQYSIIISTLGIKLSN